MNRAPQIVGILNLTPDSFSDGGRYADVDAAVRAAQCMIADGADVIDIGGESTRPGASRIDAAEQLRRVIPVLEHMPIMDTTKAASYSIDTTLSEVAAAALDAGASIINDISAATDPRNHQSMLSLAAERDVPIILMHMQGRPADMQRDPHYDDVVTEVRDYLLRRADAALAAGVKPHHIILDPGIGFGKTTEHNLQLLANLDVLIRTGYTVMLGASRKRFLGEITGEAADRRDVATAATTVIGVMAGVQMFRVHDVAANRRAADVTFSVVAHQRR